MKFKLDENLSHYLAEQLRLLGHDADTVGEEGLLSRPDEEVAEAAANDGRMLLTLDLDFSDIRRFPPGTSPGVVLFRPRSFAFREVNRLVETFISTADLDELVGCLIVVDVYKVRIRRPPPPSP